MQNACLGLEGNAQISAARTVAANAMTVRQTEALIKKLQNPSPRSTATTATNPDIDRLAGGVVRKAWCSS